MKNVTTDNPQSFVPEQWEYSPLAGWAVIYTSRWMRDTGRIIRLPLSRVLWSYYESNLANI